MAHNDYGFLFRQAKKICLWLLINGSVFLLLTLWLTRETAIAEYLYKTISWVLLPFFAVSLFTPYPLRKYLYLLHKRPLRKHPISPQIDAYYDLAVIAFLFVYGEYLYAGMAVVMLLSSQRYRTHRERIVEEVTSASAEQAQR
jgi:hypothetical protein